MNSNILSLYHTFLITAQSPSISDAAKALYISQPAVSKSIQRLEDFLNVTLLVRGSRGIHLTNEGQIFYEYIRNAFDTIAAGEDALMRINKLGIGHIRIGVSSTLCKHILLPCLKEFLNMHPHIQITIQCQSTLHTIELLENKEIDIGLIAQPEDNKKLHYIPAGTLNDIFVATPQYINGLKEREPDSVKLLLSCAKLILLDKQNITRRYVNSYLAQWHIETEHAMEVNSMELLIDFVKTGLGAGCSIRQFVQKELADGQLVELETPKRMKPRHICFAYHTATPPGTAVRLFIDFLAQSGSTF